MKVRFSLRAPLAAALFALGALGLLGCASEKFKGMLIPNKPPSVELTNAPVAPDRSNPYFYAYRVNWSGEDPDGRIDHFEFAVDPPGVPEVAAGAETVWVSTPRNEEIVFFRASQPDSIRGTNPPTASDFHVFVIKAVDDDGAESPRKSRAFYSYTIAPTVLIRNPQPSELFRAQVTPSVRIEWEGSDPDGQFSQKPVSYKYLLITDIDADETRKFLTDPDSLRRRDAPRNWEGWKSTPADTQFVQFTNLTPKTSYLFVVISFDEAGAYSPIFSLFSNCLQFTAGFAASNGPIIHIFNQYIDYTYKSGGYSADPLREIPIEVPTHEPITVNWDATAPQGSRIQGFRWMVNGNINDQTRRTDEVNDYVHWSQWSPTMPNSVTLRAFTTPQVQRFFLECADNNGQTSLGILKMTPVTPTFDRPLLIVDDTRREADKFPSPDFQSNFTDRWPSASELDTFLFARGGFAWRGSKVPDVLSTPGIFAGYRYDTVGTRIGYENPVRAALLSSIGQYKSVIWMVDDLGASPTYIESVHPVKPATVLYWMSGPNSASTLAAYAQLGGRVWLMGGGGALASLRKYDEDKNNFGQHTVISSAVQLGELGPGRVMWDGAHWQSVISITTTPYVTYRRDYTIRLPEVGALPERDTTYIVAPAWRHYNKREFEDTGLDLSSPQYARLPLEMRARSATTDPMPPTRAAHQTGLFYTSSFSVEYLLDPNSIIEDVDPDPAISREISVLDTLLEAQSGVLLTSPRRAPIMTYYHGSRARQFVFSGFAPWRFARQDCMALVDFVLQDIWNLPRQPIDRGSFGPSRLRSGGSSPARSVAPVKRTTKPIATTGNPRE